jgi:hypothetical protein
MRPQAMAFIFVMFVLSFTLIRSLSGHIRQEQFDYDEDAELR